jgi:hypothetical protein
VAAADRPVVGLFFFAPISAEYLIGYDDLIGRPLELVFGLLIFGPLYGAPALFIREAARRWPRLADHPAVVLCRGIGPGGVD